MLLLPHPLLLLFLLTPNYRGRCDADTEFVSLGTNDPFDGELSQFDWIANAESFTCVTAINETETENESEEAQTSEEVVARRK